jgi:hypothetical protein
VLTHEPEYRLLKRQGLAEPNALSKQPQDGLGAHAAGMSTQAVSSAVQAVTQAWPARQRAVPHGKSGGGVFPPQPGPSQSHALMLKRAIASLFMCPPGKAWVSSERAWGEP